MLINIKGTGGTLMGAGKMIKTARPDTKIIGTEPAKFDLNFVVNF